MAGWTSMHLWGPRRVDGDASFIGKPRAGLCDLSQKPSVMWIPQKRRKGSRTDWGAG